MRKINFIAVGLLFLLMGSLWSCTPEESKHAEVFVLIDQTGSFIQDAIDAEKTVDFIAKKANTDLLTMTSNSFDVTIYPLTDLKHNQEIRVILEKGNSVYSEVKKKREKAQQKFRDDLIQGIDQMKNEKSKKSSSQLVKPFCEKLQLLNNKQADKKIVILFSDLLEHNNKASFYNTKLNSIKKYIEKECHCGDLTGVAIYCSFQPKDTNTDEAFSVVEQAFKEFVEEANGEFFYVPNF